MMRFLQGSALSALSISLMPTLLQAAETAQDAAENSGGMPQLDASTFVSQIFWLILTFGALYYLLNKKLLPKLIEVLESRQERIDKDLDQAAQLRKEAEEVYRGYEAVVAEAHAKAQVQIKGKRDAIAAEAAARQAALDAELAKQIADAEARINAERETALGELKDIAVEVAQSATERLVGVKISKTEAKAALAIIEKDAA